MLKLENINLAADLLAARYVKAETVEVTFAREAGELISLEGPNRYQTGDALITGSTGSRWSVSRERFDPKYAPLAPLNAGEDGRYRSRPLPVLARQIQEPFTAARSAGEAPAEAATAQRTRTAESRRRWGSEVFIGWVFGRFGRRNCRGRTHRGRDEVLRRNLPSERLAAPATRAVAEVNGSGAE